MDLKPAIVYDDKSTEKLAIDPSFFTSDQAKFKLDQELSSSDKPKKGRPPKKKKMSDGSEMIPVEQDENLTIIQSNEPFINMYDETNMLLRGSIMQIDSFSTDVKEQLDIIKASKTLKGKYTYISDLTGTASNLLGTKISAIRELNKSITDSNNLEIRRAKELNLANGDMDDDRHIMDMYNAFVSTPSASYSQLGPGASDMNMPMGTGLILADTGVGDMGFNNYMANMSPAQNTMRFENDPNIQTVVVYNQSTGQRFFDVINRITGESVPNVSRPDNFLMEDIFINTNAMTARHTKLDTTYPLIVIGGNDSIMEY